MRESESKRVRVRVREREREREYERERERERELTRAPCRAAQLPSSAGRGDNLVISPKQSPPKCIGWPGGSELACRSHDTQSEGGIKRGITRGAQRKREGGREGGKERAKN